MNFTKNEKIRFGLGIIFAILMAASAICTLWIFKSKALCAVSVIMMIVFFWVALAIWPKNDWEV